MVDLMKRRGFLAVTALLSAMAGCANGNPTPPSDGAGAGSASAGPCPEGAIEACYSGPPGTLGVSHCEGGERRCEGGTWSACKGESPPVSELCNGEDDDCDGAVDDGNPTAGNTCATGLQGACALGISTCEDGLLQCVASVPPTAEVCDAVDNDCDGYIDEGVEASGEACSTGVPGACSAGAYVCAGGALVCVPSLAPSPETCNGKDDDCDGVIDEDVDGVGQDCSTGLQGTCAEGKEACVEGVLKCVPPEVMVEETCDGVDQNCDGILDDDVCATVRLEAVADTAVSAFEPNLPGYGDGDLHMETWDTELYLRFDLTSVPQHVELLYVRIEMTAFTGTTFTGGNVYTTLVPDDSWDEYEMTWNSKPPVDHKPLGSWWLQYKEGAGDYNQLCVNADPRLMKPVQEALDSDKLISFRLHPFDYFALYRSREWGIAAQRPQLVVQYTDKP